jgi:hypothetical protein
LTDSAQIHHLVDAILYARRNEPTARIKFVHAYEHIDGIPTELIPNSKILDEAFPSITIDLTFVRGTFQPGASIAFRVGTNLMSLLACRSRKPQIRYSADGNVYVLPRGQPRISGGRLQGSARISSLDHRSTGVLMHVLQV